MVASRAPLFRTDADGLFDLYLNSMNPDDRQYHNCNCCKQFIERFGGLVTVADDGSLEPAVWTKVVGGFYSAAVATLRGTVQRSKIVSAFYSDHSIWGTPETGPWSHFSINAMGLRYPRSIPGSAGQQMAHSIERRRIVLAGLADFKRNLLEEALRVLQADAVNRAERFVAPIQWLRDLHDRPKGRAGDNLLWRAVSLAPEGYCHPRSAVTGTLLEDIAAGMPFEEVRRRFNAKLHPLQYQRPQAAPSAGTIKQAERLFEEMGLAPALKRRFARLEDLPLKWKSAGDSTTDASTGGLFSHLKAKGAPIIPNVGILPARDITWEKFAATVLPTARRMQMRLPARGAYTATTTAVDPDAPSIFKWDHPVAWYQYAQGSVAEDWNLRAGEMGEIVGIMGKPTGYSGDMLVLEGARDLRRNPGLALFPECLRSELHGVRSVIEAYSNSGAIEGREEATGCGYSIDKGFRQAIVLRVFDGQHWSDYRVNRRPRLTTGLRVIR